MSKARRRDDLRVTLFLAFTFDLGSVCMEFKIVLLMACANGLLLIFNGVLISRWRIKMIQQNKAYHNIELLNKDLRSQRHDFLNHMQIAYGLIELKEYEEASNYLNTIYGKINKLSSNIKTEKIAINALLQAKSNEAESKGIHFFVNASSRLADIVMEEWALCGCISNLIDNAFEAALYYEEEQCVWVRIHEDMSYYYFEVDNTGKILDEQEAIHIFEEGNTNKSEEGHGLGLYIVKKALKNFGDVWATPADHGMIFTIRVTKMTDKT